MKPLPWTGILTALLLTFPAVTRADDLLPADRPIEQAIDHYIDKLLKQDNIKSSGQIDDYNLIRRLTLDLNGRIPTPAEVDAFVGSSDPAKRGKLVDRLLASPAFARHQATEFDTMLMSGTNASVREYLLTAFAENRTWDKMFRDLMTPDDSDPKKKGASGFLKSRVVDIDKLTSDASVAFFGVNISCARCHDHPLVKDWKQDHFFGMRAFFNRTFDNGGYVAERGYGAMKFKTVKGQDKTAPMMFLTGKVVSAPEAKDPTPDEQKKEKELLEEYKKKKQAPPAPAFSARAKLVEVALEGEQRHYFAKSIANRLWHRFFANGLVAPIDQMHSENPSSHPELLDWLARDTIANNYDLKKLIKGIVLSKTYSRSSRWDEEGPAPRVGYFAVARVRALTPLQLATSLRMASAEPDQFKNDTEKRIEEYERSGSGFARMIEQPRDDFQISVTEALLFSNNDRIFKEFLTDSPDRLLGKLKTVKDPAEKVQVAIKNVYGRPARAEEVTALVEYLNKRSDRPTEADRQMVWALLTSAEFRFNY